MINTYLYSSSSISGEVVGPWRWQRLPRVFGGELPERARYDIKKGNCKSCTSRRPNWPIFSFIVLLNYINIFQN